MPGASAVPDGSSSSTSPAPSISADDKDFLVHCREKHSLITGEEVDLDDPRAVEAIRELHIAVHNRLGCGHFHV